MNPYELPIAKRNEIRASAERLQRANAIGFDGPILDRDKKIREIYKGFDEPRARHFGDMSDLANAHIAYLESIPIDDDELLDDNWLEIEFETDYGGRGYIIDQQLSIMNSKRGYCLCVADFNGSDLTDTRVLTYIKTRAQVRQLLAVLQSK